MTEESRELWLLSWVPVHSSYPYRQASAMEKQTWHRTYIHMFEAYVLHHAVWTCPGTDHTTKKIKMVVYMQNLAFKSQVITHQPNFYFFSSLPAKIQPFFFSSLSPRSSHTPAKILFFFFQQFTTQDSTLFFSSLSPRSSHTHQPKFYFFFFQQFTSQDSTLFSSSLSPRSSHTPAKILFFLSSAVYQPRFYPFFQQFKSQVITHTSQNSIFSSFSSLPAKILPFFSAV